MRHILFSLATPLFISQKANAENIQQTGCELYLAESTIPDSGLGVFTAVAKAPGDTVGNGDVCIPLLELDWHNEGNYFNPFSDYVWAGEVMGMKFEVGSQDVESNCPGLDCAINCNLALINVGKSTPVHDTAGLHRSVHPGAGANTPYHNGTTRVIRRIPAGGELFKFYGDSWYVPCWCWLHEIETEGLLFNISLFVCKYLQVHFSSDFRYSPIIRRFSKGPTTARKVQ